MQFISRKIHIAPGSFLPNKPSLLVLSAIDDPKAEALYLEMIQSEEFSRKRAAQQAPSIPKF